MGGFKGLKRCAHCDYKHRLISQVRRHVKQAHGDRAVVCTVDGCAVRLPYNRLARHMREKHSSSIAANNKPDTVPKDICTQGVMPKAMFSRKLGKKGNKSNPTEAPSKVLPTTKSTSNNSGRTTFSDLQQFSCPTCDKPAKSRQALRKHINEVHDKIYKQYRREKSLLCDWPGCEKAFIAASKLADHRNTHTGERPYSCDHCRKDFSSKHEFSRHIRKYHQVSLREINSQIQQCVE